jgi:hypothetical protein
MRQGLYASLQQLRQRLRQTPIHRLYRPISERRQRAELLSLLDRIATVPPTLDVGAEVRRALAARAPARHDLPPSARDARVIAVGAQGWEAYGLWAAFGRTFDFEFFADGIPAQKPFWCETVEEQQARSRRILDFVTERERERHVHLVFFYADASNFTPELFAGLARLGCWSVLLGLDDRSTFSRHRHDGGAIAGVEWIAPHADLYWTTWRAGTLLHHTIGSRAWMGGYGGDPRYFHPVDPAEEYDVLFLGQSYGVRREFVSTLRRLGIRVECRGWGWEGSTFLPFEETVRLFSRAKVVLGMSNVANFDDVAIMKGRDFEIPMCGACYVTQYCEEIGDFFHLGRDIACYANVRECAEILHSLLRDPARRAAFRQSALTQSIQCNTWDHRLTEMFELLRRPLDASIDPPVRREGRAEPAAREDALGAGDGGASSPPEPPQQRVPPPRIDSGGEPEM